MQIYNGVNTKITINYKNNKSDFIFTILYVYNQFLANYDRFISALSERRLWSFVNITKMSKFQYVRKILKK